VKKITTTIIFIYLIFGSDLCAAGPLDFTLHKLESGQPGSTLLVVGGIQGDEPGGFNAASLLVTRYKIRNGSVWIVPNLNFVSIINRSRGVNGDLNRKFKAIGSNDPDFDTIEKIKGIILNDQVDLVLNLHDGSGFYRERYVDRDHNPDRWGQCIIIDQEGIQQKRFGNLLDIAAHVRKGVNRHLIADEHAYRVKNTNTRRGDTEMAKTLTYFAIKHKKSAFGVEASKSFLTHYRAYYHLRVIEAYMDLMNIRFDRDFNLTASDVKSTINKNINLALYDSRIFLDLENARNRLSYFPLKKSADLHFIPSNPLITIVSMKNSYRVYHGNRRLTRIYPQYFDYDTSTDTITMQIDGTEHHVNFGKVVGVGQSFLVVPKEGCRVNVIGFKKPGIVNESGFSIRKNDLPRRFSIDRDGQVYRIEVYRKKKFSGMILVNFNGAPKTLGTAGSEKVSLLRLTR